VLRVAAINCLQVMAAGGTYSLVTDCTDDGRVIMDCFHVALFGFYEIAKPMPPAKGSYKW
jgi:hypothetical protein